MIWLKRMVALMFLGVALNAHAGSGKVIKVLPQFLDKDGKYTVAPSLFERDAYQKQLRENPAQRHGIRFNVQWKASQVDKSQLKLKVEVRTSKADLNKPVVLEQNVKPGGWFTTWTNFTVDGDAFAKFGEVLAWRATLWEGEKQIGEMKSFLW